MQSIGWLDILIVMAYLVFLCAVVKRTRKKQHDTADYFLGGQKLPFWAAGLSLLVTALSAATFIGLPTVSYNGDLTFLATNIGTVFGVLLIAFLFLPKFYRANVQSIYSYLGPRYGKNVVLLASWTFIIGRIMASGARLFIAAIALTYIVIPDFGSHPLYESVAIIILLLIGVSFSYGGGIRTVIWTDVTQAFILITAGVSAFLWLIYLLPLDWGEMIALLQQPGADEASKLTVIDSRMTDVDFSLPYSLLAIVLGHTLIGMGVYGTDQNMVQRMLTCKTPKDAVKSAIFSMAINIPVSSLFLVIGLLLYLFYTYGNLSAVSTPYEIDANARVFAQFIAYEMPSGLRGLLLVGLFAASVTGLTSELNSVSSTLVNDTYRRFYNQKDESHYVRAGRYATLLTAAALGLFATLCIFLHRSSGENLIDFVFLIMIYAYSGLLAIFLVALFTRRGNPWSGTLGLFSGFFLVAYMQWFSSIGDYLAFPWQMLVATSCAFAICCLGSQRRSARQMH